VSGPYDPQNCPACGSPIWVGELDDGTRVPLEPQPEMSGLNRYMLHPQPKQNHGPGNPDRIMGPVAPESEVQAYADHRAECPHFDNGILDLA
jgi:hypothetical protein